MNRVTRHDETGTSLIFGYDDGGFDVCSDELDNRRHLYLHSSCHQRCRKLTSGDLVPCSGHGASMNASALMQPVIDGLFMNDASLRSRSKFPEGDHRVE